MGTSIATRSWGSTDATFGWLLHVSGGSAPPFFGNGLTVSLGTGADSALRLWGDAIGIGTAGHHAKLRATGTGVREYLLPDQSGEVGVSYLYSTDQRQNNLGGGNYAEIPGFAANLPAGLYELEGIVTFATNSSGSGGPLRFKLEGDAGVTGSVWMLGHRGTARSSAPSLALRGDGDLGLPAIFEQMVTPDTDKQLLLIDGLIRFNGSGTGLAAFFSNTSASGGITIYPESFLRFRRVKS